MQIISALLFAIGANIDCLAIGISYGVREIRIDNKNNLFIAIISSLGTGISMSLGSYITTLCELTWLNTIGCTIIIFTGIYLLYQYIQEHYHKKNTRNLEDYDIDHSGTINGKEVIALAIGLSLNNASVGIGASIAGIPIIYSCVLTFILSFIFIRISSDIGNKINSKYSADVATLCSSLLIIILGIYELFI